MTAVEKLREQQSKVPERSAPWMVAEQLMDICSREPVCAQLMAQDLDNPNMSIVEAEKRIKAFATQERQFLLCHSAGGGPYPAGILRPAVCSG